MQVGHDEVAVMGLPVEGHDGQHHPCQTACDKDRQRSRDPEHWQGHLDPSHHQRRDKGEKLDAGGDHHGLGRGREEPQTDLGQAGGEHVMHPQPEGQEPGADRAEHDPRIAHDGRACDSGHDHRGDGDRGQEDDVDLWMAENPEQMLPEHRVAAPDGIEERPIEGPFEFEQEIPRDQRREGEEDHAAHDHHIPRVERHDVDAHPRRAAFERADDQLDRRGDRGDLDKREAQKPDIGADAFFLGGERGVHEPARLGAGIEQDGPEDKDAADQETPVAIGAEPRERHVARAQHPGQQQDRDRLEHGHGKEEHHRRAVHGEELVIAVGVEEIILGHGKLGAHEHRQNTGAEHEKERGHGVPDADLGVVHR